MSCAVTLRRLADAAFHHVTHAQFAADLLDVRRAPFVSEARIARDHEQPAHVTQCGDDVLDDAVREVLLLRVIAHVLEGQHGDRRLVRKRRTVRAASNPDEAVAAARHGNQVALPALLLVERLPERRNLDLQVVLLDDLPRPDPRQQLVLGDDISPGGGQHAEDVESPVAEPHRNSVAREFPPPEVEPKPAECYLFAAHRAQLVAANSEHFSS